MKKFAMCSLLLLLGNFATAHPHPKVIKVHGVKILFRAQQDMLVYNLQVNHRERPNDVYYVSNIGAGQKSVGLLKQVARKILKFDSDGFEVCTLGVSVVADELCNIGSRDPTKLNLESQAVFYLSDHAHYEILPAEDFEVVVNLADRFSVYAVVIDGIVSGDWNRTFRVYENDLDSEEARNSAVGDLFRKILDRYGESALDFCIFRRENSIVPDALCAK